MRVRVNFTIEIDPEQYREVTGENLNTVQIRADLQYFTECNTVGHLAERGILVKSRGKNNEYS